MTVSSVASGAWAHKDSHPTTTALLQHCSSDWCRCFVMTAQGRKQSAGCGAAMG